MPSPSFELKDSMVRAGAGAGKTRGLVDKVIEVYRGFRALGEGSPRIVLTTFTRKATQELKERLILRACAEKDAELLQFVSDPAKLQIVTIHGLLNVFLKQIGHLAGLDSGFQIISEPEGAHLARLALREVMVARPESLRWLEVYGFARVLAMCRRFQTLRGEHGELKPATLADLTAVTEAEAVHWKKRLSELVLRIRGASDDPAWGLYAADLQGFLHRWRGEGVSGKDLPSKPRRSKKQEHLESLHAEADEVMGAFKKEMGKPCWNQELWPAMIQEWNEFQPLAKAFMTELEKLKEGQARYEMADLELKSLEILREKPFLGSVFSEAWDFWMIDEYQDTSPLQVEILKNLIGAKPKYLVGDPQQSIYLFRGAEVGVFREAETSLTASGGVTKELLKNYRSAPELLSWINDFMSSLGSSFARMEPREPAVGGASVILLWHAPDPVTELQGLVTRVQELLEGGARLDQICVLGRTHRNLMEVSRVFKDHGFPTHVHSSRGFSGRREVIDAQALWKFMLNPHDNLNLILLLRSPWFMVEDWRLTEWMKERPDSLWRRLSHLEDLPEAILRLRSCLVSLGENGIVHTFERALCDHAYLDLSLANDPAGRKESNLWKLIDKAQGLAKEGGQSMLDLMQGEADNPLEATEGDATSAQEPNCINLMTIHGSKGLEFDHVLVPRLGESPRTSHTPPLHAEGGIFFFPLWNEEDGEFVASPLDFKSVRRQRERELEEFDRWLYVALTRAKKTLTLSWSTSGRESWVARSSWFSKPRGEHREAAYTYTVCEEMPAAQPLAAAAHEAVQVRTPFLKNQEDRGGRHSVSELVERKIQVRASSEDLMHRWQAQKTGTRIHRALEAVKYQGFAPTGDKEDRAIEYVLELQDPPLARWIREGFTEWGFQVRTARGIVEGQIDLWAKIDGRLYVVDYKTGSPVFEDSAFSQLSLYAWALRKFGHREPVEMWVVYPRLKKTVRRKFEEDLFLHWETELGGT